MADKRKLSQMLAVAVPGVVMAGIFALNIALPNVTVLEAERRQPASLPKLSAGTVINGEFMSGFDAWASDTFVFRDGFRTIRAHTVFDVFRQTDKSGLYIDSAVGAGKIQKLDEASLKRTAEKLKKVLAQLGDVNAYFAVIPDKGEYAARYYPGVEFETVQALFESEPRMTHIEISAALDSDSWYKTDLHWNQKELLSVIEALGKAMGFEPETDFREVTAGEFEGVYTGQLAVSLEPDTGVYLTSEALENAAVYYLDTQTYEWYEGEMYDTGAFRGRDPYDMFLGGTQPIVVIENSEADTERELFIFRDSFGSSLAPLLVPSYSKVTLVDLRYIDLRILEQFTDIPSGSDVLLMYSTEILGSPDILMTG